MTSAENSPRSQRDRGERGGGAAARGFRRTRPKVCQFCADKVQIIDYKDLGRLRSMVTEHGKMKSRRITGACAAHQRKVAVAVKRARHMALMPFVAG